MSEKREAMDLYVAALDESSWENLQEAYPNLAEFLEAAVAAGNSPMSIYTATIKSGHSAELAKWCRAAAEHLMREQAG
jgi:hypothetical protein